MNVGDVIEQVRWCLDEEAVNLAQVSGVGNDDDAYMDNIIKSKINDALRWCLLYAPQELLSGAGTGSGTDDGVVVSKSMNASVTGDKITITLPSGFTRLVRVRAPDWNKAVMNPIEEDSDEYLMLSDNVSAYATNDRPVAALIRSNPMKLELWPGGGSGSVSVEICYVQNPDGAISTSSESSTVTIPEKLRPAFIYYIAFLVATAYRDSIASSLLQIAKMHIGVGS